MKVSSCIFVQSNDAKIVPRAFQLPKLKYNPMVQITKFWKWFQDNEEAIKNALLLGINTEEVFHHFNKNYRCISKRIGFLIGSPSKDKDKFTIIFTADGYRKLFPKLIALEDQAPQLQYFIAQAFIKPIQDKTPYLTGVDKPYIFNKYKIKISKLQIAIFDYNTTTKKLKINLYIPAYERIKKYDDIEDNLKFIVMGVIGEIAFRKHIIKIEYLELPKATNCLLKLIELPDYIDYLYKINSRKKTREV